MSFDLFVEQMTLPEDVKGAWERAFAREGFRVEIFPGFDPTTHEGGFLPMRVDAAPEALTGIVLRGPAVGGFEVSFQATESGYEAAFRFGAGGPTLEFAMMCVGAALLAEMTQGTYVDPSSADDVEGAEALVAAKETIREYVTAAADSQRVYHPFPGWAALEG